MTDWFGVEGPVLPAGMGKVCPEHMAGVGRCEQDTGHEGRHKHGRVVWDEEGAAVTLSPDLRRDALARADAAQACGAVRVLGGANSEYLTCELWPEHEGSHVRVTERHRFYTWTEEETEQPRDPWADSRSAGSGRVQDEHGDNEVYLRTGPTVGRVEGYSYGNGHLAAQLIIGGVEYLLALQVEEPGR